MGRADRRRPRYVHRCRPRYVHRCMPYSDAGPGMYFDIVQNMLRLLLFSCFHTACNVHAWQPRVRRIQRCMPYSGACPTAVHALQRCMPYASSSLDSCGQLCLEALLVAIALLVVPPCMLKAPLVVQKALRWHHSLRAPWLQGPTPPQPNPPTPPWPHTPMAWGGVRNSFCAVSDMDCCAVLYCAMLCYAGLCCAMLCCAVLYCAALCCAVLCCAALCCSAVAVLHCVALCCAMLCCNVLCCSAVAVLCCSCSVFCCAASMQGLDGHQGCSHSGVTMVGAAPTRVAPRPHAPHSMLHLTGPLAPGTRACGVPSPSTRACSPLEVHLRGWCTCGDGAAPWCSA